MHALVRKVLREVLTGRTLELQQNVDVQVPLGLKAVVEAATPVAGIVSPATRLQVKTSTSSTKRTEDRPTLFTTTMAPNADRKRAYDGLIGLNHVKADLSHKLVSMTRHRDGFRRASHAIGARGKVLFHGPPGTAKTTLALGLGDDLARRLRTPVAIHEVRTASLFDKFVGQSARNVDALFDEVIEAAEAHGMSVLLIDEYDAIAGDRTNDQEHPDARRAVNAFLKGMDRVNFPDHGVVTVAVTNLAYLTDAAARRRFDQMYEFRLPNPGARHDILETKLSAVCAEIPLKRAVAQQTVARVAQKSVGFSGADLERVVYEAVFLALRQDSVLDGRCLLTAAERIRPGKGAKPRTVQ